MPWLLGSVIGLIIIVCVFISLNKPRSSKKQPIGSMIYYKHCAVCHHNGTAGAPMPNDVNSWLVAYKKAGNLNALVSAVENGKGIMPAMGTCKTCTQEQLKEATLFMLPEKVRSLEKLKQNKL